MFKCDYHTHSIFSFDGRPESTPDALCAAAIERGVTDLAITDHFECNSKAEHARAPYRADLAQNAILEAKEKYRGRLNLSYGIELGQANQYPDEAEALLSSHKFDFVIGSVHNLRGSVDFSFMDFKSIFRYMGSDFVGHLFDRNIDELSEVLDKFSVDTVAHLTYLRRYCELSGNHYDFTRHSDKIEALFKKMIQKNAALEVNVSTLWRGLGFAMPDRELLSLYRECGGRTVTVGTDSHSLEHVGECLDEGFALLREVGLNEVLVVRDGVKTIIKI